MALRYAGIRILFLRRTYPELRENHIVQLKAMLEGVATWRELEKAFSFPNGSRIIFGHCAGEHDVDQFQGQEYDVICIDEATHFTEYQFSVLTACLRGGNPFPKRMYLTCNPGGVGHMWVKRLFVDREYKPGENPENYVFIQALASDNPVWKKNDPKFLEGLDNLPDGLREAWRDGRWDIFAGQYFPEFRRETHVIQPRTLPDAWPRYRVIDYGLDMLACYWAAIDYDGRLWIYRELCSPDLIVSQAAGAMRERTPDAETIRYTLAPPDLWSTQKVSGRTMAEEFIRCGVSLIKAPNQRVHGWLALKEYLKLWPDGRPGMLIFEDCKRLIRDLAAVQHDEKNPSDVAKEPHEYTHSPDAIRYLCAFRAMGAEPEEPEREDDDERMDYDDAMLGGALSEEYLTYGG
uniref:Large subunit terminase n=1 Tax=Myoviridae sp. ctEtC12 TaxID=2825062 RepID=A0A8S5V2Z6_9CAUD|nr:MAG TPA: Large subunit terminase [Myoviridae sp. ctEtC12]